MLEKETPPRARETRARSAGVTLKLREAESHTAVAQCCDAKEKKTRNWWGCVCVVNLGRFPKTCCGTLRLTLCFCAVHMKICQFAEIISFSALRFGPKSFARSHATLSPLDFLWVLTCFLSAVFHTHCTGWSTVCRRCVHDSPQVSSSLSSGCSQLCAAVLHVAVLASSLVALCSNAFKLNWPSGEVDFHM